MVAFFQFIIYAVFFILFLFVLIMAFYLLKPFKINRKRKYSTLALKLSYMFYLEVLLLLLFFILFFFEGEANFEKPHMSNYYFLTAIVLPNLGIFIRRLIKYRTPYNYMFSGINLLFSIYLLRQLFTIDWTVGF